MLLDDKKYIFEAFPWMCGMDMYTGKRNHNYFYEIPEGWVKGFGIEWLQDINSIYEKMTPENQEKFYVLQLKEKYGAFRQYFSFYTDELRKIIDKYETLSEKTCSVCGAPATRQGITWICPYCDECAPEHSVLIEGA